MAHRFSKNTVWQWNCRGFTRKRAVLQEFLRKGDRPDVIALQECGRKATLPGYKSYVSEGTSTQVATLVRRNVTAVQHDIGNAHIDHVLIELIPQKKKNASLFVLNIYSSPRQRRCDFGDLFASTRRKSKNNPLLIVGDFNAHHTAWGYKQASIKGRKLWDDMQTHNLDLITDPLQPTRKGNSVAVDTTPDLTLTGSGTSATWCNTNEDLGSDHMIIEIVVEGVPATPRKRRVEAVNWDSFRDLRGDPTPISDIAEWCDGVLRTVKEATEVVETEEDNEVVDTRLVNLWKKKKALENRQIGRAHV